MKGIYFLYPHGRVKEEKIYFTLEGLIPYLKAQLTIISMWMSW